MSLRTLLVPASPTSLPVRAYLYTSHGPVVGPTSDSGTVKLLFIPWHADSCGWRIRKTPRLGSAQRPGAARAAPAGLPKSVRLCEDLRIRHGQAYWSVIGGDS